jgi:hypothetical protein
MKTVAVMLAAAAALAAAECPNGCSGHGTCGVHDSCACYDNWAGADCSQRVCPFGLAFVDTPLGDLNHDGSVSYSSQGVGTQFTNKNVHEMWQGDTADEAHFYTECSGKGICNRAAGECECFDGFTGSSCQRTTCPNDCSGHGQCFTLREIAAGVNPTVNAHPDGSGAMVGRNFRVEDFSYGSYFTSGVSDTFDYNLWDADKNQACVCDPGFFGTDCSMRDCPRGNDPLTHDIKYCGGSTCQSESQYVIVAVPDAGSAGTNAIKMYFEWEDNEVNSGLLRNLRSESFTVKPGLTGDDYAELIQDALESFPNGVLNGVTVTCHQAATTGGYLPSHTKCSTALSGTDPATAGDWVELKVDFSNGPQGSVSPLQPVVFRHYGTTDPTDVDPTSMNHVNVFVNYDNSGSAAIAASSTNDVTGFVTYQAGAFANAHASFAAADLSGAAGSVPASGNHENSPCSSRGLCDYTTGTCNCFAGYTREDCSVQSALAM